MEQQNQQPSSDPTMVPVPPLSPLETARLSTSKEFFWQAWDFYKNHYRAFASIVMPLFLLNVAILLLDFVTFSNPTVEKVALGTLTLILFVVSFIVGIAIVLYIAKQEEGTTHIYSRSAKFLWAFVFVLLLQQLAVMGGFVLLIIPGVLTAIYLTFTSYMVIVEGKRGMDVLMGSWLLAKDYLGQIFVKMLFIGLVLLVAILLGLVAITVINSGFLAVGVSSSVTGGFSGLLSIAFQTFIMTPLSIIYMFSIYKALRAIKGEQVLDGEYALHVRKWLKIYMAIGAVVIFLMLVFGATWVM
ncbi:MAG: hypothetical protein O2794_02970 [bacterium]|nr:hypothetical protein [bacterium]